MLNTIDENIKEHRFNAGYASEGVFCAVKKEEDEEAQSEKDYIESIRNSD